MTDDLLPLLQKPGRYIGCEWNAARKDFSAAGLRFLLCFPDLYEVGMSNLGVRILYGLLNAQDGVVCERLFAVVPEAEALLRQKNEQIRSLESKQPPRSFDFLGFSLGHELCYTNVLQVLHLGGLPFAAAERDHTWPLVIGGGPCVMNPEPLAAFFDLFVFGEAEEALLEVVRLYRAHQKAFRAGTLSKEALLRLLAGIEGVYVPGLYRESVSGAGLFGGLEPTCEEAPRRIRKRFVADFESSYFPCDWVVPYIQIVHDRISVEVMRGCPNTCRFCQARAQYYPLRMRTLPTLLRLAKEAQRLSGYEEIALAGLSVSDYPYLEALSQELTAFFKERGVALSLPSIKPSALLGEVSSRIATIKKTGLTFAPEAGSPRLRELLGKRFDWQECMAALREAYRNGYQRVKLYFMIGLPTETETDLDAIVECAREASALRKEVSRHPAQVNVSITTLIPKPHTPLQWLGMASPEEVARKQEYLRQRFNRHRQVRVSFHDVRMSVLEGVLSRGDRRLGRVIEAAYRKGARFDAWDEYRSFSAWEEAFRECGIDPDQYRLLRPLGNPLPWDHLDTGVSREHLLAEYRHCLPVPGAAEAEAL